MFKEYSNYQSPSNMYNNLSDTKKHNIQVNLVKNGLIDFKKDIGNASKDDVNKI